MKPFALSHPQRRIWFVENETPGSAVNNLSFYVACRETKDITTLDEAIQSILQQNDSLRIQLRHSSEEKIGIEQYIVSYQSEGTPVQSFSTMDEAREWMSGVSIEPFIMFEKPLYRFCIIKSEEGGLGYFFKLHHIVSDGATALSLAYQISNYCQSKTPRTLSGSYKDFVKAEKKYKESEQFKVDKDFWLKELSAFPEKVSLPPVSSSTDTSKCGDIIKEIPAELRTKIHVFSKKHGLSVYKMILGALGLYLSKVCRLQNFGLGMANHNRADKRFSAMAGMFVSSLPFLFNIDPNQSFLDYSLTTGSKINKLLKEHSRYPFDLLASDMRKEFGEDISHLLNINVVGHPDIVGLPEMINILPGEATSDLAIHINVNNRDKDGVLELLFMAGVAVSKQDVEILFQGMKAVLDHGITQPEKSIGDLEVVTEEEKFQVLGFNKKFAPYRDDVSLPEIFREQAMTKGDDIALCCDGEEITYFQLDKWSDAIARTIQEKSVKENGEQISPGEFIGLSMDRGMEMIAAIWGILKVGGAYVPLDPSYPEERLQFIIEDAEISSLVVQEKFAHLFPNSTCVPIETIPVPDASSHGEQESFQIRCSPDNYAYVIYTSGTTGKPKGVPIRHHQVVNVAYECCRVFNISDNSRVLQFSSLNFDASVVDIFPTYVIGATLVVALEKHRIDAEALCTLLEEEKITNTYIPPALLAVMPRKELPYLKSLTVAGESTDPAAIKFWSQNRLMINGYGPTENTVAATAGYFQENSLANDIGSPLQNVSCYVLDEQSRLAPIGIPGELCIGGVQVSSGYINRPELNEKCFIPNPYATSDGSADWNSRLYKSGDLVRWLDNGNLEFIGRIDFQVKIRGHRIECGEVSSIIAELPGVLSCLVIPHAAGATKRLVGYVIRDKSASGSVVGLRQQAADVLPAYMVPSAFVELLKFPMTPSGKIDRRRLPEPNLSDSFEDTYVAPRTEVEETLCSIWSDILEIEKVGIEDDFFDLGGDSLLCMAMISQANEHEIPLQVAMLKNHPTISGLTKCMDKTTSDDEQQLPPVKHQSIQEPVPLPATIRHLLQQDRTMHEGKAELLPSLSTFKLIGDVQIEALLQAIDEITRRHQALQVSLVFADDDVLFTLVKELPPCKLISVRDKDVDSCMEEWRQSHINDSGPLCAYRVFQVSESEVVVALLSDHLVFDAWAMKVLNEDLVKHYNAICENREPHCEKEPFQLLDFAVWHNDLIGNGKLAQSEEFWKNTLEGAQQLFVKSVQPDKALDYYTPIQTFLPLSKDIQEAFHSLCKQEKCTPFEGYYAVYNQLLSRYSKSGDILSACVTAIRDRSELQHLVGCLTNRIYIRTSVDRGCSFSDAVKIVASSVDAAREHALWPAWQHVDSEGRGFPGVFFHYVPPSSGTPPEYKNLRLEPGPLRTPDKWPLPLVVQVLDDSQNSGLVCIGHAGFIDRAYAEEILHQYLSLLTEIVGLAG